MINVRLLRRPATAGLLAMTVIASEPDITPGERGNLNLLDTINVI
jgi:hypothetical protein